MTRSVHSPAHVIRGAHAASRRRGCAVALVGTSLLLSLVLAACATTAAHTSPLGAGDMGVFLAAPVFSTATAGQQSGSPSGTALSALRVRDGRQVWTRQLTTAFESPVLAGGTLFGVEPPFQLNGGSVPSVPLAALRGRDGTQRWQVTTSAEAASVLVGAV